MDWLTMKRAFLIFLGFIFHYALIFAQRLEYEDLADTKFSALIATFDQGFIGVGQYTSTQQKYANGIITKFNSNGEKEWAREIFGQGSGELSSVIRTRDGHYIAAGYSYSTSSYPLDSCKGWLLKFDEWGGIIWSRTFGLARWNYLHSIAPLQDGGFIAVGSAQRAHPRKTGEREWRGWIVQVDASGTETSSREDDHLLQTVNSSSDGFVVIGRKYDSEAMRSDGWILKLDKKGKQQWSMSHLGLTFSFVSSTENSGFKVKAYKPKSEWLTTMDGNGRTVQVLRVKKYPQTGIACIQDTFGGGWVELASRPYKNALQRWTRCLFHLCRPIGRYSVVSKMSPYGKRQWEQISYHSGNQLYAGVVLGDGSFVGVGNLTFTYIPCAQYGIRIVKLSKNGKEIWSKSFVKQGGWCLE